MEFRLSLIIVVLIFSCTEKINEWKTLDCGYFKLRAPQEWSIVEKEGIDSYIGGLTNGHDSLWFDYGWYGVDLSGEDSISHKIAKDTVNGLRATITVPTTPGSGYIAMRIPRVAGKNQFTIWGKDIKDSGLILKIYKSIVFKNSDITFNPPLPESKFVQNPHGSGKGLFQQNCASCHAISKELTGPALYDVVKKRNSGWIYQFLTNREAVATDTAYIALSKAYEFRCPVFPLLTKQDVQSIVDYVMYR
ncbi:cytochrome c [Paraflavisolibacter sp. H34]|uniref:c-type cytochrome n=1 Tax=Huijunlia imazamoxiresistens TaxID=3127457 RepID=UPI0030180AEA